MADALPFIEHQPHSLGFEIVIELPARPPALGGSAMARGIVSTFRKMSTKPDQAHCGGNSQASVTGGIVRATR